MTTDRKLMQMALDALQKFKTAVSIYNDGPDDSDVAHANGLLVEAMKLNSRELLAALRARLAEPEGEAVAWLYSQGTAKVASLNYVPGVRATPLFTAPPTEASIRAQAIEDCARVCEERGYDMRNHDLVRMASHKCAAAIRNLDKTRDIKEGE